jgi:peptidoglycan/LPS O-acetylase OafA/YrhL
MVAEARTARQRLSCIVLGVVASTIDWGLLELHTVMLGVAMLLILYWPRIQLPSIVNAPLALWARATFFIYLFHGFAKSVVRALNLRALLGGSDIALVVATVILATVGGIAFYLLWRKGESVLASLKDALHRQWRSSAANKERAAA